MKAGIVSSQFCHSPPSPWSSSSGGPGPPGSIRLPPRPRTSTVRVSDAQSIDIHVESSPSAYVGSGAARSNALVGSARTCPMNPDTPLPYQRPVRLAIDIDSTLHPYWDQLAEIA